MRRSRLCRSAGWLVPPLLAAVLLGGCGSSGSASSTDSSTSTGERIQPVAADGEPPARARGNAKAAAANFLAALAGKNADAFCELALPEIQRPNFAEAHAPAGDCEERAKAMFAAIAEQKEPAWALLSHGKVTGVKLECRPGAEHCSRASVTIEEVPVRGGGTATIPTPVSFAGGRWRVGHYWVEVEAETPAVARGDPVAAAQGFLDSLIEQDAKAFCEVTSPAAQLATFSSNKAPAGGSCEARAKAMFAAPVREGSEPLWAREAQAVLGPINLHCIPGTEDCRTARIKIESLPLAGGGTTIAPMTIELDHGRWLVGAIEAAPLGGAAEGANQA
jgi:hypothetical protein